MQQLTQEQQQAILTIVGEINYLQRRLVDLQKQFGLVNGFQIQIAPVEPPADAPAPPPAVPQG